jgi:peptide chain release factor 1
MLEKVGKILKRLEEVEAQLANPAVAKDRARFRDLSREHADLQEIAGVARRLQSVCDQIAQAEEMLEDPDMAELARDDLDRLNRENKALEDRLNELLIPKDPDDSRNTIVEIRAGTGGEEAALFASELFRMYSRYAEAQGWKVELIDLSPTGIGGIKEVIFGVNGKDAFGQLKYESGAHRVQRVPKTEASGRIHTSAVTVAVLPEAEEIDVEIDQEKDIRIDRFCSSGPGGQSVNTTYSAVRVTHLPTGLVVSCQDEKSQIKNLAKALKVLRSRLLDKIRQERDEARQAQRKNQVGTGDRSGKIRTYNFPQSRVTDHRIGLTVHNLEEVLAGNLGEFIEALQKEDRMRRLEEAAE